MARIHRRVGEMLEECVHLIGEVRLRHVGEGGRDAGL